ncbi:MAG: hypothetical protein JXR46_11880 [Calditrichaceae bacterium]|nr:hypothetical protein [Calditrichaceae bacterium]MBN2709734.1 hypothetical protein [Calditrichaceae bacterium]RQV92341.1 MAG: coiled coil domain-containing protein [Calditrichota bacterium]
MEDKKSYLQKMADQLKEWDTKIDELKAKADKAKTEAKSDLLKQIDELLVKKEKIRNKMKQLQAAGDGSWNDMKTGVEKSWEELKGAFSKASARFN